MNWLLLFNFYLSVYGNQEMWETSYGCLYQLDEEGCLEVSRGFSIIDAEIKDGIIWQVIYRIYPYSRIKPLESFYRRGIKYESFQLIENKKLDDPKACPNGKIFYLPPKSIKKIFCPKLLEERQDDINSKGKIS